MHGERQADIGDSLTLRKSHFSIFGVTAVKNIQAPLIYNKAYSIGMTEIKLKGNLLLKCHQIVM